MGRIETNVPIKFDLEACRAAGYDRDAIIALFRQLEFRTLMDRIPGSQKPGEAGQMNLFVTASDTPGDKDREVIIVDSQDVLAELGKRLQKAKHIAFDVETTSTHAMQAELVGISPRC